MSDYIACLIDPVRPDCIELIVTRHDPRMEYGDGFDMLRARGWPHLEWTLPVIDGGTTMKALKRELRRADRGNGMFACDPMQARGKAVALTTLRPPAPRPGLLARLGLRRKVA